MGGIGRRNRTRGESAGGLSGEFFEEHFKGREADFPRPLKCRVGLVNMERPTT
jgi:hypothetical protein